MSNPLQRLWLRLNRSAADQTRVNRLIRLLLAIAIFTVWEIGAERGWIDPFFVSKPSAILVTLWKWLLDGTIATATAITLWTALLGFSLGAGGGILTGLLLGRVRRMGDVLGPFMSTFYTLPRLALAPLFILWFGIGTEFKVVFSAIIVFFLVYYSTFSGVREVPSELVAAVRVMGAGRSEIIRKVIFPSALVWVVSGLKVSVPYGLVGVIVGEMLVSNEGLGYLISSNSNQYNTSGVFAAIFALLVIGLALDRVITLLSDRALRWKETGAFR